MITLATDWGEVVTTLGSLAALCFIFWLVTR